MPRLKRNKCEICGEPARYRFCNNKCRGASMVTAHWENCAICSKRYLARAAAFAQGGCRYCSRSCAMRARKRPLVGRFWSHVEKNGTRCWRWTGCVDKHGYGVISDEKRRQIRAPRLSYELHVGPIPEEKHVLHKCDNPACVNPEHLFLGTNLDNIADKVRKRRQYSKLTPEKVKHIKRMLASGVSVPKIAIKMAVTTGAIYPIAKGKNWTYITP